MQTGSYSRVPNDNTNTNTQRADMSLKVDLTLAVNYLPACICMGKMLVFMLIISIIPPGTEVDAYMCLAAMLYVDRLVIRNIIFDANAILLAVFFSNVHAGVRAISVHRAYQGLVDGMFLFWSIGSLVLISEPEAVKKIVDRRARVARLGPVLLMLLIVAAISHFNTPLEPASARGCRAIAFTLLSFAWIYIVGVHATHGIEYLKENSCQFIARLAPVLYATAWIAAAFSIGAVGGFVLQYMRLTQEKKQGMTSTEGGDYRKDDIEMGQKDQHTLPNSLLPLPQPTKTTPQPNEDSEAEELFRLARMHSLASSSPSNCNAVTTSNSATGTNTARRLESIREGT